MTDIVERLRDMAGKPYKEINRPAFRQAADEIERLRPYVEAFRREEERADKLGRELDDLRASIALTNDGGPDDVDRADPSSRRLR